ncbi:hypothetical protein KI387_039152, partial [Taxus chinensis]
RVAHKQAESIRQQSGDDALGDSDNLPTNATISFLINEKMNAKFRGILKEMQDIRSML